MCLFHTLFPTSVSVQFTILLACHTHMGWYPSTLVLHPERYVQCAYHTLYLPLPQDRLLTHLLRDPETLPPLDALLTVTLIADPALAWYQVQCRP